MPGKHRNDRTKTGVARWSQAKNSPRRDLRRLFYYGGSLVAGIVCAFLLGNSWRHQPVILGHHATVPAASAAAPLAPPITSPTVPTLKVVSQTDLPLDVNTVPPLAVTPRPLAPTPAVSRETSQPPVAREEKKPEAKTPQPPSPSESTYLVQVAAFSQEANAARAVSQFKARGYEADMVKIGQDGSRILYRVFIARFNDEDRAKGAAKAFRIKEQQYAYAVRYQPDRSALSPGQRSFVHGER